MILPIPLSLFLVEKESDSNAPESFLGVESYAGRRHQKLSWGFFLWKGSGMGGGADGWSSAFEWKGC